MRKLILVCLLVLPSYAMAQDVAANKPVPKVESKAEEKAKPVIVSAAKMNEVFGLQKDVQIAVLTIENAQAKIRELNAIIEKAKADGQKSDAAVTEFWLKLGIKRTELETVWAAANGQNGDIIFTKKEAAEKPKIP
jgi:hypothetical protein